MKLGVVAVLAVALSGSALATPTSRRLDLRTVEAAFYHAKIPFESDWRPTAVNPYLVPRPVSPFEVEMLPPSLRPHLVGWAGRVSPATFKGGAVWVFDAQAPAAAFARWCKQKCNLQKDGVYLQARNVVYVGVSSPVVAKVMAQLGRS